MKILFTFISWTTTVFCLRIIHLISKFDDLEEYAVRLLNLTPFELSPNSVDSVTANLCGSLFGTRGFRIQGKTSPSTSGSNYSSSIVTITDEKMNLYRRENQHIIDKWVRRKFVVGKWRKREFVHDAYPCYDYDGQRKWTVVYHYLLYTGFLFEEFPNIKKSPKLTALIDTYFMEPGIKTAMSEDFENTNALDPQANQQILESEFIKSTDWLILGDKDPLCSLKTNSRFRVCSMAANVIHKSRVRKFTYNKISEQTYEIEVPFMNFYRKHTKEICPMVEIKFLDQNSSELFSKPFEHYPLYCDVSIQQTEYHLYLAQDPKYKRNVYILEKQNTDHIILIDKMYVPFLNLIPEK